MFFGLILFVCFFLSPLLLDANITPPSDEQLKIKYHRLDPSSIAQHLAFYELYPETKIGKQALCDAWKHLSGIDVAPASILAKEILSCDAISLLVELVNRPIDKEIPLLNEQAQTALAALSKQLAHYSLKGHHVWSEEEMLALPLHEIDLARALFLSQLGDNRPLINSYEALIDLMALQCLSRLPHPSSPEEKITAMNAFFFNEMGFRFPPRSIHLKNIDLYTFLPSVLDSRRGVCLGVSILYLCVAQRLSLPLEMVTPPGHIYVRYRSQGQEINIETTARGIHIDSDEYLSVNNHSLQQRNIKEVIGLAHFNQASVYWQNGEYEKALQAYVKAEPYMKEDPFLKELMGYILILTGNKQKGDALIQEIKDVVPKYAIVKSTMAEDYLNGSVDAQGIEVIFKKVDEDRKSVLAKKNALEETLKHYPNYRAGILTLATTWLQLHRTKEALDVLIRLDNSDDPEVHYYLSILYAERYDYTKAWTHLQRAEAIVKTHQYSPQALKELRRELSKLSPE